jgi:hypothetical protein
VLEDNFSARGSRGAAGQLGVDEDGLAVKQIDVGQSLPKWTSSNKPSRCMWLQRL